MKRVLPVFLLILVVLMSACGGDPEVTVTGSVPSGAYDTLPAQGGDATEPPAIEPVDDTGLPMEPREVTFQASDGQLLTGRYYPAAEKPAPIVVLMHWVNGDMTDWNEIAPWLQNRGMENPFLPNPGDLEWWDPTWFPQVPEGLSIGVFIFSFRKCLPMDQRGCPAFQESEWLLDAQAAMLQASELEGADPARIVAIGSSIGADGAVDGCAFLNQRHPGACKGALSLSPGGYLTIDYMDAVRSLGESQPPAAAWCLADEGEIFICNTAVGQGNAAFQGIEIPGGQHGNMLLRPDLEPLPMQLILDFLAATVGPS